MSRRRLWVLPLLVCSMLSVLVWGGLRTEPGWWPEDWAGDTHLIVGSPSAPTSHHGPRPWTVAELRRGVLIRRHVRSTLAPWMPSTTAIMAVLTGLAAASAISGDFPWPD